MINAWTSSAAKFAGIETQDSAAPTKADRRFNAEEWEEHVAFDYIKQSYLVVSDWVQKQVDTTEGMEPKNAQKVRFLSRQFVSAISPSNFRRHQSEGPARDHALGR